MKTRSIAVGVTMVIMSLLLAMFVLTTACQQTDKVAKIDVNFKKWYAVGEGQGSTIEEAIQVADSTAKALLAEKLNVPVEEIKDASSHVRYLSPPMKRRERIKRRRVVITYYIARVEVRAPQDENPKQS